MVTTMMNQFAMLYVVNKRAILLILALIVAVVLLTVFLMPDSIVLAGPATSDAGHCSC